MLASLESGFGVSLLKFCKVTKDSLLFLTIPGCLARFISMCSNKLGDSFFLKSTSYFDCIYYLTYSENFVQGAKILGTTPFGLIISCNFYSCVTLGLEFRSISLEKLCLLMSILRFNSCFIKIVGFLSVFGSNRYYCARILLKLEADFC